MGKTAEQMRMQKLLFQTDNKDTVLDTKLQFSKYLLKSSHFFYLVSFICFQVLSIG